MRRHLLAITLVVAVAALGLLAEYLARGEAAAVQALFFLALLGLVIGVLRVLMPPRRDRNTAR